jgi:hypothetical protein
MGTHDDLDVEECFGEHDVEYWVRKGNRLVPATEAEVERIRAWERDRMTLARLERRKEEERRRRSVIYRLRAVVRRWIPNASRRQRLERHPKSAEPPAPDQRARAHV